MVENRFIPLYNSIRKVVEPSIEKDRNVAIKIEDMLKEADVLNIAINENDIDTLLNELSNYFRSLGIYAEKSETTSGEMVVHFKKASEEELKYGLFLNIYEILGDILEKYRQNLPYVIPESKFSGYYKILEETFEEILATKKPFVIYTSDLLKYVDILIPKELKEKFTPELFLEGLKWYLSSREETSMEISPLISMEKGNLLTDVLVFQKS